ncbi:Ribosomal protein S18 acetylase RimI [Sphingomonas sp. EC-HK361]|uniref:GNAT family N-acetyltransferase n=1 Tax=Sphingomonas sp. EC-HK361 TaxID=2038397 RepID=UPI001257CEF6|nr:GNAT family N-acetyltransferase [Sphingomonas sp. EC-HK361]VVT13716.1 Ribosomal protein S18 acetylase RimI [Sphingomonas sp. EC-HK361]
MTRLTIRDAHRTEVAAIVRLLHDDENGRLREDPSEPLDPRYLAAFDAIAEDPNQQLILATLDGEPAGTMQLSYLPGLAFRGAWRCMIESVRIASHLRNQRLGEELIGWALDRARQRGCFMVQLTSQKDRTGAHRFYERLGFTQSHAGFKIRL